METGVRPDDALHYRRHVRWENLFDDLESQLEHELGTEDADLRAEEERLRLGRLSFRDRLMSCSAGADASPLSLRLRDGSSLSLTPSAFGKDWLAGDVVDTRRERTQAIVPLRAVVSASLDGGSLAASVLPPPAGARLVDRLGIAFVLRDLCRRRCALRLVTDTGTLAGTLDRVGRDHVDLAMHEPGSARRTRNVAEIRLVPFDAIVAARLEP